MNRRARLPGADELFRATGGQGAGPESTEAIDARIEGMASNAYGRAPADEVGVEFGGVSIPNSRAARSASDIAAAVPSTIAPWAGEAPPVRTVRVRRSLADARPTGRERHDEKITVYCSPEELLQIEHARLNLRGSHGLAVDRGRIVREAVAVVLADLEAKGDASVLVRRLRGR